MGNKDIFDDEDKNHIQSEYETLVNNLVRCKKPGDRELIDKAFRIANEGHWNMRRKSGEPYIIHPISVAKIVNQEIGLGAKSILWPCCTILWRILIIPLRILQGNLIPRLPLSLTD